MRQTAPARIGHSPRRVGIPAAAMARRTPMRHRQTAKRPTSKRRGRELMSDDGVYNAVNAKKAIRINVTALNPRSNKSLVSSRSARRRSFSDTTPPLVPHSLAPNEPCDGAGTHRLQRILFRHRSSQHSAGRFNEVILPGAVSARQEISANIPNQSAETALFSMPILRASASRLRVSRCRRTRHNPLISSSTVETILTRVSRSSTQSTGTS